MFLPVSTRQLPSHCSIDFPGGSIAMMFSRVMVVKFSSAGRARTACARGSSVRYCLSETSRTPCGEMVSSTATWAAKRDPGSRAIRKKKILYSIVAKYRIQHKFRNKNISGEQADAYREVCFRPESEMPPRH